MEILIIEDADRKLEHLRTFLLRRFVGANVTSRQSWSSGLEAVLGFSYDLILLDMTLPSHDVAPGEAFCGPSGIIVGRG